MNSIFRSTVRGRRDSAACSTEIDVLRAWQQALAILVAAWVSVFYLFSDTVFSVLDQWIGNETYSYCFIAFPIALYLIWEQRNRIISLAPQPNYWGLPILAVISVVWLLGQLGAVLVVQAMALVAMLQVLVFTVAGWPVTRMLLYPLGVLIFAVPFGGEWVRPLQDFTAMFTVKALQITGVPVFKDGWIITTPSRTWVIIEACSGIRYVNSFVFLGYLFSYWNYRSWLRRLSFMVFCFFGGIVANGVRAYASIIVTNSVGGNHLILGWILFSVVVLITFLIGLLWREPINVKGRGDVTVTENKTEMIHVGISRSMVVTALGAVALLALAPLAVHGVFRPAAILSSPKISAPSVMSPWRAVDGNEEEWKPLFAGADAELAKTYMADGRRVQLYIVYYHGKQRQGAELISDGNHLVPESQWRPVSGGSAQAVIDGESLSVNQVVSKSNDRTMLLWSWYWIGGKLTSNRFFGKLLELKSRLLKEQKGSALIAVAVDVENGDMRQAADTLQDFLGHLALLQALEGKKSD